MRKHSSESLTMFIIFLRRKCIIDKNAKIGKDVIIMNKDVSMMPMLSQSYCLFNQLFYNMDILFAFSMRIRSFLSQQNIPSYVPIRVLCHCRAFMKQIDRKMDFTFGQELPLSQRRQQYKMAVSYKGISTTFTWWVRRWKRNYAEAITMANLGGPRGDVPHVHLQTSKLQLCYCI